MKYTALTPIKHDGKDVAEGDVVTLEPAQAERLLAVGAIAEQSGKGKTPSGDAAVTEPAK